LGGGFGSLGGSKPGLSSFASPGGTLEIKGLKAKADKPFGTAQEDADSEDEDGGDSDTEEKSVADEERKSSQPLLSQQRKFFCSYI
jgi:Ran-binding protein 3